MSSTEGFVDLRAHNLSQSSYNDDSVWPSFTDIMTVVVMIFLMALVVILLRNVELVQQLRATMEAERAVAQQKETLASRIGKLERYISELRLNLMQTEEDKRQAAVTITAREGTITALQADIGALEALRQRLIDENSKLAEQRSQLGEDLQSERDAKQALQAQQLALSSELDVAREHSESLATDNIALWEQIDTLRREGETLRDEKRILEDDRSALLEETAKLVSETEILQDIQEQLQVDRSALVERLELSEQELSKIEQSYAARGEKLSTLDTEFSELKTKYDRLIRPARSADGRYVVEIRYVKRGDVFLLEVREPDNVEFRAVSRAELDRRLAVLQQRDPARLYTKIVIPEDSGLSYNEAWNFTFDILQRYDYYYR